MIAAAHQPLFLPWIGYIHKIDKADVFIIADNVQFTSTGWIARNKIKTPNGAAYLTVPLKKKKHVGQLIRDIQIADEYEGWKNKHLKMIRHNYNKTPFFQEVYNIISYVYEKDWNLILDLDTEFIKVICEYLEINTPIYLGSEINVEGRKTELIVDICEKIGAESFMLGQGGSLNYIDRELLDSKDINYFPQNFIHPRYPQRFGEFMSNLSVIDLLFNMGKQSIQLIREPSKNVITAN